MDNKVKYLNLIKAVIIALLIFSNMPPSKADGVDTWIQALKDKDEYVRTNAANNAAIMAGMGVRDARVVEPLITTAMSEGMQQWHWGR